MKVFFTIALLIGAVILMQSCRIGVDVLKKFDTTFAEKMELRQIASAVNRDYTATLQMPIQDFEGFCKSSLREGASHRDTSRDFWGTPFRLGVTTGKIVVSSAGPDHTWDTVDDIRYTLACDYKGPTEASTPGPWRPNSETRKAPPACASPPRETPTTTRTRQSREPRPAPAKKKKRQSGFDFQWKLR